MLFLITGASGSGKSEYAEGLVCEMARRDGTTGKIYLATMENKGEEAGERIARHRKLREGKGFLTVESPYGLSPVQEIGCREDAVLLECLSNLLANLMFSKGMTGAEAEREILRQIEGGRTYYKHLAVVTNEIFSEGIACGDSLREYVRALGSVNCRLAAMADVFCEVVYSIPVFLKGERLCRF